jgi:hypothetical protein
MKANRTKSTYQNPQKQTTRSIPNAVTKYENKVRDTNDLRTRNLIERVFGYVLKEIRTWPRQKVRRLAKASRDLVARYASVPPRQVEVFARSLSEKYDQIGGRIDVASVVRDIITMLPLDKKERFADMYDYSLTNDTVDHNISIVLMLILSAITCVVLAYMTKQRRRTSDKDDEMKLILSSSSFFQLDKLEQMTDKSKNHEATKNHRWLRSHPKDDDDDDTMTLSLDLNHENPIKNVTKLHSRKTNINQSAIARETRKKVARMKWHDLKSIEDNIEEFAKITRKMTVMQHPKEVADAINAFMRTVYRQQQDRASANLHAVNSVKLDHMIRSSSLPLAVASLARATFTSTVSRNTFLLSIEDHNLQAAVYDILDNNR